MFGFRASELVNLKSYSVWVGERAGNRGGAGTEKGERVCERSPKI